MIAVGEVVHDTKKRKYRIEREVNAGGQGVIFEATELATGTPRIVKVYHDACSTPDAARRLDMLVAADLSSRSPALCAPTARLHRKHGLGAIQPRAAGISLDELFQSPTYGLLDALAISFVLCQALHVLEESGDIAHGDISASNVIVNAVGTHFEVYLIDFDNFAIPGQPLPAMRGQDFYAAPELLTGHATPTTASDRFALGVLLHELLFQRHPFAALVTTNISFDEYVALLRDATWVEDPADRRCEEPAPGLPVGVLPRDVHALFRAALRPDPAIRPTAGAWVQVLGRCLGETFVCDACAEPFVNDATRYTCPHCGAAADRLELHVGGRVIPLVQTSTTVGRTDVGGDLTISREHAVFRRSGFALRIKNLSSNGTAVHTAGKWHELTVGEEIVVAEGDEIVFAPNVKGIIHKEHDQYPTLN
jgi:DNA-binding helix-hairpin-helix protein with protein kinase domain